MQLRQKHLKKHRLSTFEEPGKSHVSNSFRKVVPGLCRCFDLGLVFAKNMAPKQQIEGVLGQILDDTEVSGGWTWGLCMSVVP